MAHIRLANGDHVVIDGQSMAPLATGPTTYRPDPKAAPGNMDTIGRKNALGPTSVATPGNLMGWCEALDRFGTFSRADVMEPAIRHASRGFRVTPYLHECVTDCADRPGTRSRNRPPVSARRHADPTAGTRLVTGDYAETLRDIVREGPRPSTPARLAGITWTHGRVRRLPQREDLTGYRTITRDAIRGHYRGFEIIGPPPPSSGPLHIIQMLNILEGYDLGGLGFGTPDTLHLLAETLKIAFADRAAATADPAFVNVPVEKLLDKAYAADRRGRSIGTTPNPGAPKWRRIGWRRHTTHLTVADGMGNIVASTQTINSLFGARYIVPGTGMIPNNYMFVFDPHPGRANSIAPGKRITSRCRRSSCCVTENRSTPSACRAGCGSFPRSCRR